MDGDPWRRHLLGWGGDRFRWSWAIPVTYVGISLFHAVWDSMRGISAVAALIFSGNAIRVLETGFLPASAAQTVEVLATVLYIVGITIVAVLGIVALRLSLRPSRSERTDTPAAA